MSHSIPEYYQHFIRQKPSQEEPPQPTSTWQEPPQEERPRQDSSQQDPAQDAARYGESRQAQPDQPPPEDPTWTYRAHTFTVALGENWTDKTLFSLAGPTTDGLQHSITITIDSDVETDVVRDYADWHTRLLEKQLKGCRVLKKEPVSLTNGLPAYRVIYVWHPMEDKRLYQDQLYVLHEGMGYMLTASFTKKTRKTLGPRVTRMMRSFNPSP